MTRNNSDLISELKNINVYYLSKIFIVSEITIILLAIYIPVVFVNLKKMYFHCRNFFKNYIIYKYLLRFRQIRVKNKRVVVRVFEKNCSLKTE